MSQGHQQCREAMTAILGGCHSDTVTDVPGLSLSGHALLRSRWRAGAGAVRASPLVDPEDELVANEQHRFGGAHSETPSLAIPASFPAPSLLAVARKAWMIPIEAISFVGDCLFGGGFVNVYCPTCGNGKSRRLAILLPLRMPLPRGTRQQAWRRMLRRTRIGCRRPQGGFLHWLVRSLLWLVIIPGVVSDLVPLWSRHRQTIADKVANSVIIRC